MFYFSISRGPVFLKYGVTFRNIPLLVAQREKRGGVETINPRSRAATRTRGIFIELGSYFREYFFWQLYVSSRGGARKEGRTDELYVASGSQFALKGSGQEMLRVADSSSKG